MSNRRPLNWGAALRDLRADRAPVVPGFLAARNRVTAPAPLTPPAITRPATAAPGPRPCRCAFAPRGRLPRPPAPSPLAEALNAVEDAAYNEIKRWKSVDLCEQEIRLRVLAPMVIANGDKLETADFACELLAFAEH